MCYLLLNMPDASGQSDPYVRVQVQNTTKGRTEVVNNSKAKLFWFDPSFHIINSDLNPVWDQIIYIPGKYNEPLCP
jgi:Ca2+-dependent lipid-binding protein